MSSVLRFISLVNLLVVAACEAAEPEPEPQISKTLLPASPAPTTAVITSLDQKPPTGDTGLRRGYSLSEMRLGDCAKLEEDGTLVAHDCTSGCVLFGPYLSAPADSDLRVSFEIESLGPLLVASDIVSSSGQTFHGALDQQGVESRKSRKLGYRVHLFQRADGIETRLWVKADGPINFRLTNFVLQVE
jgi:hypothetical protein